MSSNNEAENKESTQSAEEPVTTASLLASMTLDPKNDIPLGPLDKQDDAADASLTNLGLKKVGETFDKSVNDATITSKEHDNNASTDKSPMDVFLASLPNDIERAAAKKALEDKWDLAKYETGGSNYREWNARTPLIKNLQAQKAEIDKLNSIIKNSVKNSQMDLTLYKEQAEEALKEATNELGEADRNDDAAAMRVAYKRISDAKRTLGDIDSRLGNLKEPETEEAKPPTPEEVAAYNNRMYSSGNDFKLRNKDWWFDNSPTYDADKVLLAQKLESEFLTKYPGMDPYDIHMKVEVELGKNSNSGKQTSADTNKTTSQQSDTNRAARNPAIEKTSSVYSSDYNNTSASKNSEAVENVARIYEELHRDNPEIKQRIMTAAEFRKNMGNSRG